MATFYRKGRGIPGPGIQAMQEPSGRRLGISLNADQLWWIERDLELIQGEVKSSACRFNEGLFESPTGKKDVVPDIGGGIPDESRLARGEIFFRDRLMEKIVADSFHIDPDFLPPGDGIKNKLIGMGYAEVDVTLPILTVKHRLPMGAMIKP
jgi:hypothetical protein